MYYPHKATVVIKVQSSVLKDKYGNKLPDPEASAAASKTFKCYAKPILAEEKELFGIDITETAYRLTADYRWTGKEDSVVSLNGRLFKQVGEAEHHNATSLTRHAKVVMRTIGTDVS